MATAAHSEVPADTHKAPFAPFERDTFASQLLWFAICFIALYVIMSRIALPHIGGILAERRQRVEGDLKGAQRLKEEADGELAAYEKALGEARGRAQVIANETRDRLNAEADHGRKDLEHGLNTKLAVAEKTIAGTKQAALANVRGIAVDATAAIVERLIGTSPPSAEVQAAVDAALKR